MHGINPQSIMIVGTARSGTTWVERAYRYAGYTSLGECFSEFPSFRRTFVPEGFPIWNGQQPPVFYLGDCQLHHPQPLVFKALTKQLSLDEILELRTHLNVVVCCRHPLASTISLQQAAQTAEWNHVLEDGTLNTPLPPNAPLDLNLTLLNNVIQQARRIRWLPDNKIFYQSILEDQSAALEYLYDVCQPITYPSVMHLPVKLYPCHPSKRIADWCDGYQKWADRLSCELTLEFV